MTDAERQELDEYRRQDLLRRMRAISQEQWDASWRRGLEHDLYLMTFHAAPAEYGIGVIAPPALAALKRLAELTGVWWLYEETSAGPTPIALSEAEQRFSKVIAEDEHGELHSLSIPDAKHIYENAGADEWELETIRLPWDDSVQYVYRMKANRLVSLQRRAEQGDWELRFGKTTIAYVTPRWVKLPN